MEKFCFTFGQEHPLRDCWIEVIAPSYDAARLYVVAFFGIKFAFQYPAKEFKTYFFHGGRAGNVVEVNEQGEFLHQTSELFPMV